jgi:hypothetical protein
MQNHVKMLIPCASYDLGAMPMRLAQVPPDKLLEPPLTSEDFFGVIEKILDLKGLRWTSKNREKKCLLLFRRYPFFVIWRLSIQYSTERN